jgi:ATP-dependent Lon protease
MKTIQEELGGNTQEEEIDEMLVKAKDKKWDEKPKAF